MVAGGASVATNAPNKLATAAGTGLMVNGAAGKTVDLLSEAQFGDVELHLEFLIPNKSNSGIYLMGRYELQIYDSFGVEKDQYPGIECGGIYPRWIGNRNVGGHSPRLNASTAPGTWQSFDITFRAPRFDGAGNKTENARFVRVIHNGKVIHQQVEVVGPTRSSRFNDEAATGPVQVQGDHGPIAFRSFKATRLSLP
jgi:hypothetical protein